MSPNQLAANRIDPKLTLLPEPAKRATALTGRRHSLTGKIHIATPPESDAFDKHCLAYREALAPVGIIEEDLVQEIAEDRWRLKRSRSVENSIFAEGHNLHSVKYDAGHDQVDAALAEGKTWQEQSRQLQLLTLYETRVRRAIEKNTIELKALQEERKAAYAKARREAIALAQLAETEGEAYDPGSDFTPAESYGGFVFDAFEIARAIHRDRRLHRALHSRSVESRTSVPTRVSDPRRSDSNPKAA